VLMLDLAFMFFRQCYVLYVVNVMNLVVLVSSDIIMYYYYYGT